MVIIAAELAPCQYIEQRLLMLRSCQVPARNIVMKEQRQVTIGAITLADEKPIERFFGPLRFDTASLRGKCQRQSLLSPVFVMNDGVAGKNRPGASFVGIELQNRARREAF